MRSQVRPAAIRRWDVCEECCGYRELHVNRQTGEYHVMFPAGCPRKDACEAFMLRGFERVLSHESDIPEVYKRVFAGRSSARQSVEYVRRLIERALEREGG